MAATPNFRRQVERRRVTAKNDGSSETSRDLDAAVVLRRGTEQRRDGEGAECDGGTTGSRSARGNYPQRYR